MAIDYNAQYFLLLAAILAGIAFGVLCDILRMFRMLLPHCRTAIFFEDVAFCVVCGVIMIIEFYNFSNGRPRLYAFLAAFLSAVAWRMTVGRLTERILKRITAFVEPGIKKTRFLLKKCVDFLRYKVYTIFVYKQALRDARHGFYLHRRS